MRGKAGCWTPARVDALRLALLIEAAEGRAHSHLALAALFALRPLYSAQVSADRCARLGTLLRGSGDPQLVAFWRRMVSRSRALLVRRPMRRMEVA